MKELLPALRQYRHNDNSGFVAGYDKEETEKIFEQQAQEIKELSAGLAEFTAMQQALKESGQEIADLKARCEELAGAAKDAAETAAQNICLHDETVRGGAIWEICQDCGAKWADDMGGKPDDAHRFPDKLEQAFKTLSLPTLGASDRLRDKHYRECEEIAVKAATIEINGVIYTTSVSAIIDAIAKAREGK